MSASIRKNKEGPARSIVLGGVMALLLIVPPAISALETPHPVPGVAAGFSIQPLMAVAAPTAIAFGPGDGDGPDLYATVLTGTVERIHLTWTSAGPVATDVTTYASGLSSPLGLWWVDERLFVADSAPGEESGRTDGRVQEVIDGEAVPVVTGLPNGRHNTNHLRQGPGDLLYITNGNPNDNGIDGGDADVLPLSGAILALDLAEVDANGPAVLHWVDANGEPIPEDEIATHPLNDDFNTKVSVYATGFRNVFGVAFSQEGVGYTATNGADVPDSQDAFYRIEPGADYGYPFCFNEGPPGGVGDEVVKVNNPLFPEVDCSAYPPADGLLGWHVCATGLDLPTNEGDWAFPESHQQSVYVGECGPFQPETVVDRMQESLPEVYDPTHDEGHKVARVVLDETGHAVEVKDFVTGLALPTDVLFGPDGAMYIADAGAILRVAPAVPGGVSV